MKLLLPLVSCAAAALSVSGGNPSIRPLPDFDARVIASGDWLSALVCIDWKEKGRLMAAITPHDPLNPRAPLATDRLVMLGDADGDGLLDSQRVFAKGLKPVNSFVFHRDGIIIAQGSQIVWLRDTDQDDVADRREVLFSGFGSKSFPASTMSFRRGLDGWVYGVQGRGAEGSTNVVGRGNGPFGKIPGGVFRFMPDGSAIETVSAFDATSASLAFSWDGELFFSRADGAHVGHVGLPELYIVRGVIKGAASWRKIEDHQTLFPFGRRDRFRAFGNVAGLSSQPASTAISFLFPAGAVIYEGGAWPERYQGNYYVCDPLRHLIHEDVISRPESAYFEGTRRLDGEFIVCSDETFRPFELRVGPDGAMYILDAYRADRARSHSRAAAAFFAGSERTAGRIWRVQHKQARRVECADFCRASNGELARALESPNAWVRQTALRLMMERDDRTCQPELERLLKSSRFPQARVAAVWALHHLELLSYSVWTNALEDAHAAVQKNAWLTFAESKREVTPEIEKLFGRLYKEADERVRLAMLRAMANGPLTREGRESIAKLIPDFKDVWSKSIVYSIAQRTPMDFVKVAFASDKSENFRELVVPLVEQLAREAEARSRVLDLTEKHAAKAEKLTAAVREALAKSNSR